jgi:putative DNA base modification enzyme with NMAD domain
MPSPTRYGDLAGPYGELVADLTRGRLHANSRCHLDPDIRADCLPRLPGWRGALGQFAAAQGHLATQRIDAGDLFLFWGLFRHVEHRGRWTFVDRPEHRIWGWLQVAEIVQLGPDGSGAVTHFPWLAAHPHARSGWKSPNVLYIGSRRLTIRSKPLPLAGYGTLHHGYRLSAADALPSVWTVPDWLHPGRNGSGMTYHPSNRWNRDGTVQVVARGQEFVAAPGATLDMENWVTAVLMEAASTFRA